MADGNTPIVVNSEKQLFIDDKFIAENVGVVLTMNPPLQIPEPVLAVDKPWEGVIGAYNSVLKEGDRFRLWYDVILPEGSSEILTRYCVCRIGRRYPLDEVEPEPH